MAKVVYNPITKKYEKQESRDFKWWAPGSWSSAFVNATGLDNLSTSSNDGFSELDAYINSNIESDSVKKFWNSLSEAEKLNYLDQFTGDTRLSYNGAYAISPFSATDQNTVYDIESFLADIDALSDIEAFDLSEPVYGDFVDSSADLYNAIDQELAGHYDAARQRLTDEAEAMRQSYADQLKTSSDYYDRQASGLLSNQYLANAQTYDTLQSDMRKARQNALEAGASAGIRLAGNVNALLTAQNKQSQTAMDTSNALAEMLLQQRNAAAGIRSDYRNYMSDNNQRMTDLDTQQRSEREALFTQRRSNQEGDYNRAVANYDTRKRAYEDQFTKDPTNKFSSEYQTYMYRN